MSEKKIRVTKAQRFEDIKALLNGENVAYGTTIEIAVEVIDHELELLAKKNSGDKKMTSAQQENEGYKAEILEYLRTLPPESDGVTCTDILKNVPSLSAYQVQKVASLVRQLKLAGMVNAKEVKGKSLFSIA